jgi:ATP-dependent DNA helicase RecG
MMNELSSTHIHELIRKGESLTLEFKSDAKGLPDRELVAAVIALANTEGGDLLLGVEDDGHITGLHPNHQSLSGLPALIANKTNPPLSVRVETVETRQGAIARIMVQKSRQLVSTSEGLLLRRRLMADGRPAAVPFYPHEFVQRQSAMGLTDPSAMAVESISVKDLNLLERHRIREAIRKYGGDQSLLPLADSELDGALGLTVAVENVHRPTLTKMGSSPYSSKCRVQVYGE